MAWIKLDPITKRRFARFRKIKRGYYSFIILMGFIVLSIFAPLLAESRALFVSYQGHWYFPTFQYFSMATFNQTPPAGWSTADLETEYLRVIPAANRARTEKPVLVHQGRQSLYAEHGMEAPRTVAVIDEAWCIGCTLCIKACPTDAILGANKFMHTVIAAHCTGCELCIPVCPVDCIELHNASGLATGWSAWSPQQAEHARAGRCPGCGRPPAGCWRSPSRHRPPRGTARKTARRARRCRSC